MWVIILGEHTVLFCSEHSVFLLFEFSILCTRNILCCMSFGALSIVEPSRISPFSLTITMISQSFLLSLISTHYYSLSVSFYLWFVNSIMILFYYLLSHIVLLFSHLWTLNYWKYTYVRTGLICLFHVILLSWVHPWVCVYL